MLHELEEAKFAYEPKLSGLILSLPAHSNDYLFEINIYLSSISGIQIRAQADDNDNVIVKFHSAKSSQYPGFSCRVSSQVKPFNQSSFGSVIDVGHIDVSESESTSPGNSSSTADNGSKLSEKHGTVLKLVFFCTILLKFPFFTIYQLPLPKPIYCATKKVYEMVFILDLYHDMSWQCLFVPWAVTS